MEGRFGTSSSVGPAEIARAQRPRQRTDPNLIPSNFATTGLEAANEDGDYGGLCRLMNSTVNSPASGGDPRDRSRSRSPGHPTAQGSVSELRVEEINEMEATAEEAVDAETFLTPSVPLSTEVFRFGEETVGADGTTYRFTSASPKVKWNFNDFSIVIQEWLAKLCSGRCVCCNKGSLWYMFQGWGTVSVNIHLTHRDTKMEIKVWTKMCG